MPVLGNGKDGLPSYAKQKTWLREAVFDMLEPQPGRRSNVSQCQASGATMALSRLGYQTSGHAAWTGHYGAWDVLMRYTVSGLNCPVSFMDFAMYLNFDADIRVVPMLIICVLRNRGPFLLKMLPFLGCGNLHVSSLVKNLQSAKDPRTETRSSYFQKVPDTGLFDNSHVCSIHKYVYILV